MMSRFEPQFPLQHQQKDLRLSINMADSVDQPLHVATATNEVSQSRLYTMTLGLVKYCLDNTYPACGIQFEYRY